MHAIALSLDTIVCCAALAPASLPNRTAWRLAAGFGVCDAAASALAPWLGMPLPVPLVVVVYLACAAILGAAALRRRTPLWLLPALLSLDNLVDVPSSGSAALAGLASAVAAIATLKLGAGLAASARVQAGVRKQATAS